jgi:hypothetical protein
VHSSADPSYSSSSSSSYSEETTEYEDEYEPEDEVVFMHRAFLIAVMVLLGAGVCPAQVPTAESTGTNSWAEVDLKHLDRLALTPRAKQVLESADLSWKHAQTEHFSIHYEQAIFARKVARMAEFFYNYIVDDLQGVKQQERGRSHIFIFRSEKRWREFCHASPGMPEWIFSQVEGPVMFLQQAENTSASGEVLAHEMTHLVMNRLFAGQPPLWLNEGLAEYYGAFGYAAFKGVKKSKRAQFGKLATPYPFEDLVYRTTYPREDWMVEAFYATAKYLVAFLMLDRPHEQFLPFLEDLLEGTQVVEAFGRHYGLYSLAEVEKEFRKFAF